MKALYCNSSNYLCLVYLLLYANNELRLKKKQFCFNDTREIDENSIKKIWIYWVAKSEMLWKFFEKYFFHLKLFFLAIWKELENWKLIQCSLDISLYLKLEFWKVDHFNRSQNFFLQRKINFQVIFFRFSWFLKQQISLKLLFTKAN